jgi:hypothetical protein
MPGDHQGTANPATERIRPLRRLGAFPARLSDATVSISTPGRFASAAQSVTLAASSTPAKVVLYLRGGLRKYLRAGSSSVRPAEIVRTSSDE